MIRADVISKLLTVRREILSSVLVALEIHLEWTLKGKVPQDNKISLENLVLVVTSELVNEAEISDL